MVTSGWAIQSLFCTIVLSAMTMYKYTFVLSWLVSLDDFLCVVNVLTI